MVKLVASPLPATPTSGEGAESTGIIISPSPLVGESRGEGAIHKRLIDRYTQRMPFSISGTNALIVFGVTTSAPVLIDNPAKP